MEIESFEEVAEDDIETVHFDCAVGRAIVHNWKEASECGVGEVVKTECIDTSGRWSNRYECIVKDVEGRFWRTYYSTGSTEQQSQRAYEFKDSAEFQRVHPYFVAKERFLSENQIDKFEVESGTYLKEE